MNYITPKSDSLWESLVDSNVVAHVIWSYSWTLVKIVKEQKQRFTNA